MIANRDLFATREMFSCYQHHRSSGVNALSLELSNRAIRQQIPHDDFLLRNKRKGGTSQLGAWFLVERRYSVC